MFKFYKKIIQNISTTKQGLKINKKNFLNTPKSCSLMQFFKNLISTFSKFKFVNCNIFSTAWKSIIPNFFSRKISQNILFPKFFILLFSIFLITTSCRSDPSLYDRAGFDPGTVPPQEPNLEGQNRLAPDYYYRQQNQNPQQQGNYPQQQGNYPQGNYPQQQGNYPQGNYPQGNYQYPPAQQYGSPYQVNSAPGSRYYSNPYAIPASPYYPQYDADQYYVPPAYYGAETQQNSMQKPQGGRAY